MNTTIDIDILTPRLAVAMEIARQEGREIVEVIDLPGRECFLGKRLNLDDGTFLEVFATSSLQKAGVYYCNGSFSSRLIHEFPREAQ